MPSKKNLKLVEDIKKDLDKAKSVVLADYKGLNVDKITKLRQKVKEAGGQLKVIKNTLLKIGFKNNKLKIDDQILTGPTAIIYSFEDELAPLKALYQFAKKNDLPKVKMGFLNDKALSEAEVIDLAKLPTKRELYHKLVYVINSPRQNMVYVLKANINKLVFLIDQIKQKKGGDN